MTETLPSYHCESVRAFRMLSDKVVVVAKCPIPPPSIKVKIIQDDARIFPPFYRIVSEEVPVGDPVGDAVDLPRAGGDVPIPFGIQAIKIIRGEFDVPASQGEVRVDSDGKSDDVKIENAPDPSALIGLDAGGERAVSADRVEGIGYSDTSIDEAFADAASAALAKLPASHIADGMTSVRIVETGALYGGIVGFHHRIFVRVHAG